MRTLSALRNKVVNNNAFCSGCFAKWHCAGDCHHKTLNTNGTGDFAGTDRCHITRELTKDALLARIAQSGGVFWHGEAAEDVAVASGKEFLL
jgi:uncharacterized protein